MENRFMQIIPPKGYEIDKEKSTFERIVFKPIVGRWRDDTNNLVDGYFISSSTSKILKAHGPFSNVHSSYNIFATESQAKSAIAMARISQIMANDERFGGVITNDEWKNDESKYIIESFPNFAVCSVTHNRHFLAFHTRTQAELFMEENEDLLNDYFII